MTTPKTVLEILGQLEELGDRAEEVSIGDVVECFGRRSYGPFLLVPGLVGISPIGGIPGAPTFLAVIVALFAGQMLVGRTDLWIPTMIADRSVSGDKLERAIERLEPLGRWLDRWFHRRMRMLTKMPFPRIAAGFVLLLCCAIPPLELLPFAVAAPMVVITAFGLALLVSDGLLMLATLAGGAMATGFAIWALAGNMPG